MQFQEVVEAEGHLIDSHIMEDIFDKVVEYSGRFEVEEFRIGRTNSEASYLRLKVEAPEDASLQRLLQALHELGCSAVDAGDAVLREVERDRCAPEDFYSTTNHRTYVRHGHKWLEAENQRMDAMIVVAEGRAFCRRLRDLRQGDQIVTGLRGIRVAPESKERDRLAFAFMSNGISSERQVETAVRQTVALVRQTLEASSKNALGQKVIVVAGPVVVHTGGVAGLSSLIRGGCVQAVLAGNALGVHDIEAALFGTSLGVRLADGRQEEHGHRNHMRAINAVYHAGSVKQAVESGRLGSGVLYECVKAGIPFVLAGSLRDDGPLPDTITDMNAAQDAYAEQLKGAGLVLCLGSMLHSIATGNMLPSWVKIVCVDINPAVATKVSDRGTGQAVGVVTDVGLFLDLLSKALAGSESGSER
jgi:lysine-ketoglutarate reductase/saccharopine dehydrogenase-like protein (TIGR00300 family)